MSTVCLVNPPNHAHDRFDLAPPLALMVLAEIASDVDCEPVILDLALPRFLPAAEDPERFYREAAEEILACDPRIIAFTSMAVNSHVCLELARLVKERAPRLVTVLGGSHFSAIHSYLLSSCPWVDHVIVGEGETGWHDLLVALNCGAGTSSSGDGPPRLIRSSFSGSPRHPFNYDLVDLTEYFAENERRVADYEGGRGCVFKCAFCYSPNHYDSVREVAPDRIVDDWSRLIKHGVKQVFMVQDNFTNDPKHAVRVCDALAAARLPLPWNGYATLPQLTPNVVRAIGRSGCNAIYLGIDAVSPTQQISLNKRFYRDDERLLAQLGALRDAGVTPTCAFMIDLFDYRAEDFETVLRLATCCASLGVPIRLNTFTRYPGSALSGSGSRPGRYSEAKVRVMLDCPEVVCQNDFARQKPAMFPFHATEVEEEVWTERLAVVRLAQALIPRYPADMLDLARGSDNRLVDGLAHLAKDRSELKSKTFRGWQLDIFRRYEVY